MENGKVTDKIVKSALEHYGRVMYYVQLMEYELLMIVCIKYICEKHDKNSDLIIKDIISSSLDKFYRMTLGQLINTFEQQHKVPRKITRILKDLKNNRNFLAHRFFSGKVSGNLLNSKKEWNRMIKDLKLFESNFNFAWNYLNKLRLKLISLPILSNDTINDIVKNYLSSSFHGNSENNNK